LKVVKVYSKVTGMGRSNITFQVYYNLNSSIRVKDKSCIKRIQ